MQGTADASLRTAFLFWSALSKQCNSNNKPCAAATAVLPYANDSAVHSGVKRRQMQLTLSSKWNLTMLQLRQGTVSTSYASQLVSLHLPSYFSNTQPTVLCRQTAPLLYWGSESTSRAAQVVNLLLIPQTKLHFHAALLVVVVAVGGTADASVTHHFVKYCCFAYLQQQQQPLLFPFCVCCFGLNSVLSETRFQSTWRARRDACNAIAIASVDANATADIIYSHFSHRFSFFAFSH